MMQFWHKRKHKNAQVIIEYTFCFVIILLLIYGCVMAFRWAGLSLVNRRIAHDETLVSDVADQWGAFSDSPLKQFYPDFYNMMNMNLVFNNW